MKIISWNLKNVGQTKLAKSFSPGFNALGLGNTVLDYVSRVVMGDAAWNAIPNFSTNPADLFVVVELKSGGRQKGMAVSGTCIPTISALTTQLNAIAQARYPLSYQYKYVVPAITGYHETVGVIFNTVTLDLDVAQSVRDSTTNRWINPRTPYLAQFTIKSTGSTFQVVGVHAPPPNGSDAVRFRPPIDFCRKLPTIQAAGLANTFLTGDFNCNPADSYTTGMEAQVQPFAELPAYITKIPNGTLSRVRTEVARGEAPPANYLSGAYDNIMFNATEPAAVTETVVDLIGNARNMSKSPPPNVSETNTTLVLNAYNAVSDHLPVVIEW